jgi:hypothetical protein
VSVIVPGAFYPATYLNPTSTAAQFDQHCIGSSSANVTLTRDGVYDWWSVAAVPANTTNVPFSCKFDCQQIAEVSGCLQPPIPTASHYLSPL